LWSGLRDHPHRDLEESDDENVGRREREENRPLRALNRPGHMKQTRPRRELERDKKGEMESEGDLHLDIRAVVEALEAGRSGMDAMVDAVGAVWRDVDATFLNVAHCWY
jgi:hypothetical protein